MGRASRKVSRKRRVSRVSRKHRKHASRVSRGIGNRDIHHFKETINGGMIGLMTSTYNQTSAAGGVFIMHLTDFPAFTALSPNFQFARLNKCKIEFIPKFNMQANLSLPYSGATASQQSISGTLITALDQVPLVSTTAAFTTAPTWNGGEGSNDSGVTFASGAASTVLTCSYVRGLQSSREKELYKKQSMSFYPAFYDYTVSNPFFVGTPASQTLDTGVYERRIKKWVNCQTLEATSVVTPTGPLYYGPVWALDVNVMADPVSTFVNLFDVRFTYSMSFKRLRGV